MTPAEQISLVMGIGGLLIGAGGLVATVVSIVFNYKSRVAHYRQTLYNKQIEAFVELFSSLTGFYLIIAKRIQCEGIPSTDDSKKKMCEETTRLYYTVNGTFWRRMLYLPNAMTVSINQFFNAYQRLVGVTIHPSCTQYALSCDPLEDFNNAFAQILEHARKGIGTEPLTHGIITTIGSHKWKDY